MKIAIVQDELIRKGGAEQVVLSFQAAFPNAKIYTLSYNPDTTYPEFQQSVIISSWIGKLIKSDKNLKRFFFPLGILAMRGLKIKDYDVVLQSTTHCAKYIDVDESALVITYCHTPFRLAWRPHSYEQVVQSRGLKKILYKIVIRLLKHIDKESASRTDWFITNSTEVIKRIQKAYKPKNEVIVINPSVKCDNFHISDPKDYYLVVSRLEPYKKVDLVIEAFNKMPEKKMLIVGKGSLNVKLRAMAGPNIQFKSNLQADELADIYASCKAFIFPQHEDYGITPLEANASGRPVIAYGAGGVLDTMVPYKDDASKATAIFFPEQTVPELINAITRFETLSFNSIFIREHAEKFDEQVFVKKIKEFVIEKYNEHKS